MTSNFGGGPPTARRPDRDSDDFAGDGFLSFSFDTAGLNLDPTSLGFHWTMYCGNDVIEGLGRATAVPEPAPVGFFLLGLGLIGLGAMRQRKTARDMVLEKVRK